MQAAIIVILLSFCAILALPVPVDKSDQSRVQRMLSIQELESELEDIENRVDAVRTKVKEEPEENNEKTTGISPTEKNVKPEEPNNQSTDNSDKTQIVVEKITAPSTKPSVPSANPEITPTTSGVEKGAPGVGNSVTIRVIKFKPGVVGEGEGKETKAHELEVHTTVSPEEATIETTVEKLSSGKSKEAKEKDGVTVSVEKIPSEVEKTGQEVGVGGEKEENQNEKPTESFVVEKVKEKEPEKEKQIPAQSSVTKLANDRQSDDEEVDLEGGKLKESEGVISIQKISPAKGNEVQEKISTNEENVNKEPAVRIRVEKVADAVEETKEKKADESRGVTVEKVGNIQAKQEEEDLETEGNGKSEIAESQEKRNDIQVEVVKERREIDQVPGQVTVEKLANDYEKNDLGIREAGKREIKEVMVTVQKDESEEPIAAEAKRSQIQKASEDEDLGVRVEKLPMETSLSNDASLESEKTITVKVEKFQPSTVSVEAQKVAKPNVEVTVEKLKAPLPSMKPAVETEEPTSKRVFEEEKLPSEVPTTERPDEFKATVEKITSEEEDLKNSGGQLKAEVEKVPSQDELLEGIQLRDAIRKTEKSQDEEQELENEQEQELETEQETPEERKLALEFEKALKEERNNKQNLKTKSLKPPSLTSPSVTNKPHEATTEELATKETESGKKAVKSENESKRGMTIEELELAELANNVLSDDNEKMKTEPGTERPLPPTTAATTTAEKVLVVKVQEQRNITVTVTKEQNENLLSEKETAQEEKKLKEELAKELKQEKAVPPSVLVKIAKVTEKPDIKPTTKKIQENPEVKTTQKELETGLEKEQEDELEYETDAKK